MNISWKNTIQYEQPLNELIRVCLRLEYLFARCDYYLSKTERFDSVTTIETLFSILNVLNRPDFKSKLTQELNRHQITFKRLEQTPEIDRDKLSEVSREIDYVLASFSQAQAIMTSVLKNNEFIQHVKQQHSLVGGLIGCDSTGFHHWKHLSNERRQHDLTAWLAALQGIRTGVELLLRIIRDSTVAKIQTAKQGFYQASLDAQQPSQLVIASIPENLTVFPNISVGRHGLSITFYTPEFQQRPQQTQEDVIFMLAICTI